MSAVDLRESTDMANGMFTILGADGKEYGPVSAGKLHEWIAGGRANLQTKARRAGETEWMTLADFPEVSQLGTNSNSAPPMPAPEAADPFTVIATAAATTTSATLELEPASRWLRLAAQILDNILAAILMLPGFTILLSAGFFTKGNQPNAPLLIAGFGAIVLAALIVLGIQIYLLTVYGQTVGKKCWASKL